MSGRISPRVRRLFVLLCAGALCFGFVTSRAEAASFTFTKIADTDTAIPGGTGNFASFGGPILDGSSVVFGAVGACFCVSQMGVYSGAAGSLQKLVDANTPIPGGTGNFAFFGEAAASGGTMAFRGDGAASTGIYASAGGSLTTVADRSTAIPDGVGSFQAFGIPVSVDNGRVLFVGVGSSLQRGIYALTTGTLTRVVDTNTPIPGGSSNFGGFAAPSARGGNLAFLGLDPSFAEGIYTIISGSVAKAADTNTPRPGASDNFASFGNPAFDGSNVAFTGFDPTLAIGGVYAVDLMGTVKLIADTATPVPGGTGNFVLLSGPAIDNGSVLFVGFDEAGHSAVYRGDGGMLTRLVGAGDLVDGKLVAGVGIGRQALSGSTFGFVAAFEDGSQGVFVGKEALPTDVFLHKSGSRLILDGAEPTAVTPVVQDSATLKFIGGNPWKAIGTWSAAAAFAAGTVDSLSPLHAWLGLTTSDDVGTRFDLRTEVIKNDSVVASGEVSCITGVVRDPTQALEVSVPFGSFSPTPFNGATDVLSLRVLARIGTNGSGGLCGGHSNAAGLRLYFDAVSRPSRFDVLLD